MHETWHHNVRTALRPRRFGRTLAAFNLNVDVVARVTPESLQTLIENTPEIDWTRAASISGESLSSVKTPEDFIALIRYGLKTGKSALLVRDDERLLPWWRRIFSERTESMGGQAGIIANQMAALGATSAAYAPFLSTRQASFFEKGVLWPRGLNGDMELISARDAGRPDDLTREPWVFEYRKGDAFPFPDGTLTPPRANRAIVTTAIQGPERRFQNDIRDHVRALGQSVDVAFMAGYHQCGARPDDPDALHAYIDKSCSDLHALTTANPRLKIHIEYVPAQVQDAERELYRRLGAHIHSFGINEVETRRFLRCLGYNDLARRLEEDEQAFLLYQAGLIFLNELNVERVHIHNLGYYVVVLKKPYERSPRLVRQACLFASGVNACKARYGGFVAADQVRHAAELPLSDVGFQQLRRFADEAERCQRLRPFFHKHTFLVEGVVEADDHIAIVVPSHIVSNPVATVGMGDTISSSAYVYEIASKPL